VHKTSLVKKEVVHKEVVHKVEPVKPLTHFSTYNPPVH